MEGKCANTPVWWANENAQPVPRDAIKIARRVASESWTARKFHRRDHAGMAARTARPRPEGFSARHLSASPGASHRKRVRPDVPGALRDERLGYARPAGVAPRWAALRDAPHRPVRGAARYIRRRHQAGRSPGAAAAGQASPGP